MESITLAELAKVCNGELVAGDPEATANGVSTDTRTIDSGEVFVALKGENHDGHDFAQQALDKGGAAVIVSKRNAADGPRIIVDDTLQAFGKLGQWARDASDATFIAVTGSAGKTTTKDMIGSIVELQKPSLVAPATENNEIGVPRLLINLQPRHEFCVLELAMRGRGEIAYLARICRPHIGVITNVGRAHIGRLGDREAIAAAKAELLTELPADGTAVLNSGDFFFNLHRQMAPCPVIAFGDGEVNDRISGRVRAENVKADGVQPARFDLIIAGERRPVQLKVPGVHNVENALAAAAATQAAGVDHDTIKMGLESFSGADMRSQVVEGPNGSIIINDAYNASPTSTPEALKMLGQSGRRRTFVFGDMLELGDEAEKAHREIGNLAVEYAVDWLITVGKLAAAAAIEAENGGLQVNAVETPSQASALLEGVLEDGDVVLVKGSRATAVDTVVKDLLT